MARSLRFVAAIALAAMVAPAWAQTSPPRAQRLYDPSTEVRAAGTVASVDPVTSRRSGRRGLGGLHLTLKTATESLAVHLGPQAFLQEQALEVKAGDGLEVLGSRVQLDGEPVLLAREVKKGDRTWTLRDAEGRPMWRGPGHRERGPSGLVSGARRR